MISLETISIARDIGLFISIVWMAMRGESRSKQQLKIHDSTLKSVAEVAKLVNGPLSASLKETAKALDLLARNTGREDDILAAIESRKAVERNTQQILEISEFKQSQGAIWGVRK